MDIKFSKQEKRVKKNRVILDEGMKTKVLGKITKIDRIITVKLGQVRFVQRSSKYSECHQCLCSTSQCAKDEKNAFWRNIIEVMQEEPEKKKIITGL